MKIDTVIFYTNDLKAITSFYKNTLGFKYEYGGERYSSFIFDNNTRLGIKIKEKEREVPGSQILILKTEDVESLYEEIRNKEIHIYKDLTKESWGTTFSILDLDGNKVEFVE